MRIYKYMNIFLLKVLPYIAKSNLTLIHALMIKKMLQLCQVQKQPSRGILRKKCSENMQQIYRRTPKCDFNRVYTLPKV